MEFKRIEAEIKRLNWMKDVGSLNDVDLDWLKELEDLFALRIVGKSLKKSINQDFERWYLSEGYIETERIGVYKNGCNIILHKHLFYRYVNDVKF